jgi:catechol 2,3-dioxygenase-like lactoylglutathione lyase family enzyme
MATTAAAAVADKPVFIGVDHVSWTVPDLDAAIHFYVEAFGATEMYRLGPIDAAAIPRDASGRDWMQTHVNVPGACLRLAMLKLAPNLNFQLVQYDKPLERSQTLPRNCDRGGHHLALKVADVAKAARYLEERGCTLFEPIVMDQGPLAGKTNLYCLDPWGHQLELVD